MSYQSYRFNGPSRQDRLNHAAKTIQRYKDGGLNAARRTIQWFISSDPYKTGSDPLR